MFGVGAVTHYVTFSYSPLDTLVPQIRSFERSRGLLGTPYLWICHPYSVKPILTAAANCDKKALLIAGNLLVGSRRLNIHVDTLRPPTSKDPVPENKH